MPKETRLKELRIHPGEGAGKPALYEAAYVSILTEGGVEVGRSVPHWVTFRDTPTAKSATHVVDTAGTTKTGSEILSDAAIGI